VKNLRIPASFVFLFSLLGFIIGGMEAGAADAKGGSREDPLVTKSYVHTAVEEKFRPLEAEVGKIKTRIAEIENSVSRLDKQALKGTSIFEEKTAVVRGQSGAVLRNGPDEIFTKVGSLPNGVRVKVINESNGWFQIKTDSGLKGWVEDDYLKISS